MIQLSFYIVCFRLSSSKADGGASSEKPKILPKRQRGLELVTVKNKPKKKRKPVRICGWIS
jgi:hypothetical protein